MRSSVATIATALMVALAGALVAAQPRVINAELRTTNLTGGISRMALEALAKDAGTAWLAYAVPMVDGERWICDGTMVIDDVAFRSSAMRLERGRGPADPASRVERDRGAQSQRIAGAQDPRGRAAAPQASFNIMRLEGARQLWVLFRFDAGSIDRIRIASDDCTLDAGGLVVHWLPHVRSDASVTALASVLSATPSRRVADGALTALAMHQDAAALERLITTARDGATTHLRGQALFWLAQRAGDQAIGAISDAIANDPETDVKKRAVFALSQLPKDEGVPRLIEVARTNANPAVRRQAMFWLGQSRDPRAVTFFEEILFK